MELNLTEVEWEYLKEERLAPEKLEELRSAKWFKKLKQRLEPHAGTATATQLAKELDECLLSSRGTSKKGEAKPTTKKEGLEKAKAKLAEEKEDDDEEEDYG